MDEKGVITTVNDAAVNLLGYAPEELMGHSIREIIVDFPEAAPEYLLHEMESVQNRELHMKTASSGILPVLFSVSEVAGTGKEGRYLVCTARDISEIRLKERQITAEKERLLVTLRSIGDAVLVTDKDGKIVLMNSMAEMLTGWQQKEAAGRSIGDVLIIKTGDTVQPFFPSAGYKHSDASHQAERDKNIILIDRSGNQRQVIYTANSIAQEDSTVLGMVFVVRDITERVRMEQEIVKAQQLESLGLLAGGIAHDFNNMLTGILGYVNLVQLNAQGNDLLVKYLDLAEKALFQARDLTQQLLTFSKGGTPIKETVSVSQFLVQACTFSLRGSKVKAEYHIAEDLWPVDVDKGQINQVINNLVINAVQAMPEGGTIRLCAENLSDLPRDMPNLKPGQYVRITVEDQGKGIPQENLEKVFDPYFTTKEKGNGLGLSIVYSIIRKHGGHILVESQEGKGTTFTIYLPASQGSVVPEEKEEQYCPVRVYPARVLVMDDDEVVLKVVSEMLANIGCNPTCVRDGAELLHKYKKAMEEGSPFDLVIMDLTIPGGLGGQETMEQLLEMDPDVKAVVSSGYSTAPVIADFKKYGFKGVIPKPYRLRDLSQLLNRLFSPC